MNRGTLPCISQDSIVTKLLDPKATALPTRHRDGGWLTLTDAQGVSCSPSPLLLFGFGSEKSHQNLERKPLQLHRIIKYSQTQTPEQKQEMTAEDSSHYRPERRLRLGVHEALVPTGGAATP